MTYLPSLRNSLKITLFISASVFVIALNKNSLLAQISSGFEETSDDQVAGITSLMSAVSSNDIEGISFFAKGGAGVVNQKNLGGATALHIAGREGNFEAAKILIENGADVNSTDKEGWTPLMRASLSKNPEIVDLLLNNNAIASALNAENESAIIHAANSDCVKCLSLMFDKFNFTKLMDIKILQEQINSAYLTSQSRENKELSDILNSYQDRVVKVVNLLEPKSEDLPAALKKEGNGGVVEYSITESGSGKKFKFVVEDDNKKSVKSFKESEEISLKKSENINITTEKNSDKKYSLSSTDNVSNPSKKEESAYSEAIVKKKFTFVKANENSQTIKAITESEKVVTPKDNVTNTFNTPTKKKFLFKSAN